MNEARQRILVIKHGAFGDLITATGAFKAIRHSHHADHITLLTSPQFISIGQQMGYFDNVYGDKRSNHLHDLWSVLHYIRGQRFHVVYDLQNSPRTALYFYMTTWGSSTQWSGIAKGCSHPQRRPDREMLPAAQRFADQLRVAGLPLRDNDELLPDVSWLTASIDHYHLHQQRYCLLVPGSSRQGVIKRWPVNSYSELARKLIAHDVLPVLIAGADEYDTVQQMVTAVPGLINLWQKTSFGQIAKLARYAVAAVGNDTGPTHLIAATGCTTILPWSKFSDPAIYAPRGHHVHIIYQENLADLGVDRVWIEMQKFL